MQLIKSIFSGFWVWFGFIVLVALVGNYTVEAIKVARVPKYDCNGGITMERITLTENQKAIVTRLGDATYTPEYLEEWLNRSDNVYINALAALYAMGASGFYRAVLAVERAEQGKKSTTTAGDNPAATATAAPATTPKKRTSKKAEVKAAEVKPNE